MPTPLTGYRIFVASPGDVEAERQRLVQVVADLNRSKRRHGIVLELRRWEDMLPGPGEDAQAVINRQIGEYDIFVLILWSRLGTETERAPSGTVEEYRMAL